MTEGIKIALATGGFTVGGILITNLFNHFGPTRLNKKEKTKEKTKDEDFQPRPHWQVNRIWNSSEFELLVFCELLGLVCFIQECF